MRRIVLDFDLAGFKIENSRIESVELLHLLKLTPRSYEGICRIELKGPSDPAAVSAYLASTKAELLHHDKGGLIMYCRGTPLSWLSTELGPAIKSSGIRLFDMFELRNDHLKAAYLGDARQIGRFLRALEARGIPHRVISLGDAKLSKDSHLSYLTGKQRQVLMSAYKHGYYASPRRISAKDLAKRMNLSVSTVHEHLRKAESRLVSKLIDG